MGFFAPQILPCVSSFEELLGRVGRFLSRSSAGRQRCAVRGMSFPKSSALYMRCHGRFRAVNGAFGTRQCTDLLFGPCRADDRRQPRHFLVHELG